MKNLYKLGLISLVAVALCFSSGAIALGQTTGATTVQTNSATNVSNYQATLNGYLAIPYLSGSSYIYFQWGTTTGYGNQSNQQPFSNSGSFNQNISALSPNTTYHFRALAQGNFGTVYGQDMTFITGQTASNTLTANAGSDLYLSSGQNAILQGSGYDPNGYGYQLYYQWTCTGGTLSSPTVAQPSYTAPNNTTNNGYNYNSQTIYTCTLTVTNTYGNSNSESALVYVNYGSVSNPYNNAQLSINKQAIDLTSRSLAWSKSITASPSDVLSFSITLQAGNQDVHNVIIRDILPVNLTYRGNLTVNTSQNYSGDIVSGINIGTVYAGQPVVVAYQAQVAPSPNFAYGSNSLINSVTATSTDGASQSSSVTVTVNNSLVYGATTVSTGLTNNFLTDSFLLPLLMIVAGLWLYFSGSLNQFSDWLKSKK